MLAALVLSASAALAQAPTPDSHPGFRIAEAIAEAGCVLTEENTNLLLFENGILPDDFPPMAIALLQDGILRPTGNGTLTLVHWGPCTGAEVAPEIAAEPGD